MMNMSELTTRSWPYKDTYHFMGFLHTQMLCYESVGPVMGDHTPSISTNALLCHHSQSPSDGGVTPSPGSAQVTPLMVH